MLSWPDFDIMSFGYSMNMYLCILSLAFFYSWAVFGTGMQIHFKITLPSGLWFVYATVHLTRVLKGLPNPWLENSANVWSTRDIAIRSKYEPIVMSYAGCVQVVWNEKIEYYCTPPTVQWDGRTVQLNLEDNVKETCFQIWSAVGHILIRSPVGLPQHTTFFDW